MKIAVIDNTCNSGYVMMRYLNDYGYDAELILLNKVSGHADPVNDTYDKKYFDRIINTYWKDASIWERKIGQIKDLLNKYDFVIGSDYAPALYYKIGGKLDVFVPHGTDVFNYPFERFPLNRNFRNKVGHWLLARPQRLGITHNTEYFFFELTNEENEKYIRKFKGGHFKRVFLTPPQIYTPQYTSETIENFARQSNIVESIRKYKEGGFTVIFHHCQQQWKNPYHYLFDKGNDKLIRGVADFINSNPQEKIKLVMVERGTDVDASKQLVHELGIDENVTWLPFMPRKEIMACLHYADLGIGELGHSWYTYTVVSEFMVMGVPIIHKCDIDYYRKVHNNIYPMYTANSSEDISRLLEAYFADKNAFRKTGQQAKDWYHDNILVPFMSFIKKSIEEKQRKLAIE